MGVALALDFLEHTVPPRPYLWEYVNTVPHGQTSTASAVEKVAAKLEMPTFNNQNGAWATFLLFPVVCWHGAFAAQAILEPVILGGGR